MAENATAMESSRNIRIAELEAQEKAEREAEDVKRMKAGRDGKSRYVLEQEKLLYSGSMNLDERIRRGRAGLARSVYSYTSLNAA
ncbi:hypothetical protein FRC00_008300 [Tulasnella sp. 408]|nr:hypothetical protein FRC00_008300 [Tulasnella sp. 408]